MIENYTFTHYQNQLDNKIALLKENFLRFSLPEIQIYPSPITHYRMRAEFRIWHKGSNLSYVMFDEHKRPYNLPHSSLGYFPIGSLLMNRLMEDLLEELQYSDLLRNKLFQADFLTTLSGEALITLIYHKTLGDDWAAEAEKLAQKLNVGLVGRSRGQKRIIGRDYVIETLNVNGHSFQYQQKESSFTQPNAQVCEAMLSWAVNHSQDFGRDLLELYCGNGNFTLPLSKNFNKLLATEVSKPSVDSATFNIHLNQISNIQIARLSSQEFCQALNKEREFYRLKEIHVESYDFSSIFVDPPRAGMDAATTAMAQGFDHIIYISCNPETLQHNLETLTQTHSIEAFAVFDQFPYTHHLESGVILKKL